MVMLDANVILRYILNDNEDMVIEATEVIKSKDVIVTIEVIAEVIYVLKRIYGVDKQEITESILDFIDCILYAYKCIKGYEIFTFDKKLKKFLL